MLSKRSAGRRLSGRLETEGRSMDGPGRAKSLRLGARTSPAPPADDRTLPPGLDGTLRTVPPLGTAPPPRTVPLLPPLRIVGPELRTDPPLRMLAPPPDRTLLPPPPPRALAPPPPPRPPPPRCCAHSEPADNSAISAKLVAIFHCLFMSGSFHPVAVRTFPPWPTRARTGQRRRPGPSYTCGCEPPLVSVLVNYKNRTHAARRDCGRWRI